MSKCFPWNQDKNKTPLNRRLLAAGTTEVLNLSNPASCPCFLFWLVQQTPSPLLMSYSWNPAHLWTTMLCLSSASSTPWLHPGHVWEYTHPLLIQMLHRHRTGYHQHSCDLLDLIQNLLMANTPVITNLSPIGFNGSSLSRNKVWIQPNETTLVGCIWTLLKR